MSLSREGERLLGLTGKAAREQEMGVRAKNFVGEIMQSSALRKEANLSVSSVPRLFGDKLAFLFPLGVENGARLGCFRVSWGGRSEGSEKRPYSDFHEF